MNHATLELIHAREIARKPSHRTFVRGGVTFIVDPSVSVYEWFDHWTVRIHPDAVEAMLANLDDDDPA